MYKPSEGYDPKPSSITREQAKRVARQYSTSGSLLVFSFTGEITSKAHREALLRIIGRMYGNVKRGKGYCLHRSQLMNLFAYVYRQKGTNHDRPQVSHRQVCRID